MNDFVPMTETAYYILFSLTSPRHGYDIIKFVDELTQGRIRLGSGTVYGTLKKMEKENIITIHLDEKRKTVYKITAKGTNLLKSEIARIKKLFNDTIKLEVFLK